MSSCPHVSAQTAQTHAGSGRDRDASPRAGRRHPRAGDACGRLTRGRQHAGKVLAGGAQRVRSNFFRGARRDDLTTGITASGSEIDDVVGRLEDVEVVLDDDDRVPGVHEAMQDAQQLLDIREVESCRRLIEDVQRAAGVATRELGAELDALRLAPAKLRRRLTKTDVASSTSCSVRIRRRIRGWFSNSTAASSTVISRTSAMLLPRNFTSSASRLYRRPLHTSHGT